MRSLGHLPIGTAPTRTSFILLDFPLPWAADLADEPSLGAVLAAIQRAAERGEHWRLQGIVPITGAPQHRIVAYHLPRGGFVTYDRYEAVVAPDMAVETAVAMIDDPGADRSSSTGSEAELLICTHGRRDACCGSSGTKLWKELVVQQDLGTPAMSLCRTSHTGGHRFAPTAIHLPSGMCWAWLDVSTVGSIVRRDVAFDVVADHYRGSCALATPAEQIVEHAVLREVGWSWLGRRRSGSTEFDRDRWSVELAYMCPDGANGVWSAEVVVTARVPVPECGGPLDGACRFEDLLTVAPRTLSHRMRTTDVR